MSDLPRHDDGRARHESIHARCVHPTGTFIKFEKTEIEQSIAARFEQQVARYPDRLAVKTGNYQLTYDALNRVSNRLARAILEQRGEGQEPIALLLSHGASVIVGLLGVLKAGKIHVPMDPSFPRTRIAYILEDSQAGLIVTDNENLLLANKLVQDKIQLINTDELDPFLSIQNPGLSTSPDDLVYILYTSGSTGQPKGVVENHRTLLHEIMNLTNEFHISADDRLTLLGSPSFSGSLRSIYGSLLNGAGLCSLNIREEGIGDLATWLIQEEITIYRSVATVFRHFASNLTDREKFPKLRLITVGGEPVYSGDVELYKTHFSQDCIFLNGLRITEAGSVRHYFVDKETQITGSIVPVGYALEETEVLLLDDDDRPVDLNQIGEIAVKSRYISLGYWRRPDLTKAKFLPDPEDGEERIYHTGDLGIMYPDGCLVHLGRKDFQVKIRGYRVEVTEIEAALLSLDDIKEAVVVARADSRGDQRLIAYLVPVEDSGPAVSMIRQSLVKALPDYMIPSDFVTMDALPLTPSSKIDRAALPDPSTSRPELDIPFVAPRTPEEDKLAKIWTGILELDEVGIHDNFFDLGGNSLMATQIMSQVTKKFNKNLPLAALLYAPTIEQLAVILRQPEKRTRRRTSRNW